MSKKFTRYHKKLKCTYLKAAGGIIILAALFLPSYVKWEAPEENMFTVSLNGETVGVVENPQTAEKLLQQARKSLVSGTDELVFIDADMSLDGKAVLVGKIDEEEDVVANMTEVLRRNIKETTHRSYAVKVNNYMVNLGSREDVLSLLQQAVDKYDTEGRYQVNLAHAQGREFNVLTAQIEDTQSRDESASDEAGAIQVSDKGGFERAAEEMFENAEPAGEKDFDDYELGLVSMNFAEEVEIVEVYLDDSQLTGVEQAADEVIKEQEVSAVY
ncbi:MAG: peptidase M23, partial [Lachnospiraceae bacterium]